MRLRLSARSTGFTLAEILTVVSIIGMFVAISTPAFMQLRRRQAIRIATSEIRSVFHLVRSRAIAQGRNSGVKFREEGGAWTYAIYDDGDRDGLRNDDIRSGTDPLIIAPRRVVRESRLARIGLPPFSLRDPDGGPPVVPGSSPVRFNRSTLCSFSPNGSGTSGTIFLTTESNSVRAVRVFGATGRIRTLTYNLDDHRWSNR